MKRIISLVLLFMLSLSLFSCGIKKEDDGVKYKDGALKYVTLPDYKGEKVTISKDTLQAVIDRYLLTEAEAYKAKNGDDVYVDILSVKKVVYIETEDGKKIDQYGEELTDLEGKRLIENLGADSFSQSIEFRIIGLKIGDTIEFKITLPDDFYEQKYQGEEVYIKVKFENMECRRGDVVDVDYTGYYIDENDEIVIEDGKKKYFDKNTSSFYLGSHLAIDDFEEGLKGMKIGETKQFFSTFPDDYGVEDLNGKKVIFECTVKAIRQAYIYNDDYVKANHDFDTVEEFEKYLIEGEMQNAAITNILDNIKINKIPQKEYEQIVAQVEEEAKSFENMYKDIYKITFDKYLEEYMEMTREEYITNLLKTDLAYYAIAEKENITVTDEEFNKGKKKMINTYQAYYMDDYKLSEEDALNAATRYVNEYIKDSGVYETLMFEKVREHIFANTLLDIKERTYKSVTIEIAENAK